MDILAIAVDFIRDGILNTFTTEFSDGASCFREVFQRVDFYLFSTFVLASFVRNRSNVAVNHICLSRFHMNIWTIYD